MVCKVLRKVKRVVAIALRRRDKNVCYILYVAYLYTAGWRRQWGGYGIHKQTKRPVKNGCHFNTWNYLLKNTSLNVEAFLFRVKLKSCSFKCWLFVKFISYCGFFCKDFVSVFWRCKLIFVLFVFNLCGKIRNVKLSELWLPAKSFAYRLARAEK